jgi:hypothetical protein
MSATDKHNLLAGGSIAHVNFRVRGEKLGHGEEVFLVQQDDAGMRKVRFNGCCRVFRNSLVTG